MRILSLLFLIFLLPYFSDAQVTLVREAPNDSFDLSCPACTLTVADVSITKGQHALPMNLQKPVSVNLMLWRYYDKILGKDVFTHEEQIWTTCTQLLDEVPEDEMLSIHINLDWTDSSGQESRLFLVIAGLTPDQIKRLPLESVYEPDTYSPLRFAAVAQIKNARDEIETYDCIYGSCTLQHFDTKTGSIGGLFEFTANRVGMEKQGFFVNGVFER